MSNNILSDLENIRENIVSEINRVQDDDIQQQLIDLCDIGFTIEEAKKQFTNRNVSPITVVEEMDIDTEEQAPLQEQVQLIPLRAATIGPIWKCDKETDAWNKHIKLT